MTVSSVATQGRVGSGYNLFIFYILIDIRFAIKILALPDFRNQLKVNRLRTRYMGGGGVGLLTPAEPKSDHKKPSPSERAFR